MSKKTSGIYKITNDRTGETYIGQSKNIERRIKSHENELRQGTHHNRGMQSDYLRGDTFTYTILEETSPNRQTLHQKEERYISKYNSFNQGYNQTPGGQYDKYKGYYGHGGGRLSQKTNYTSNNYNSHNTSTATMSDKEVNELCLGILFFLFWPLISLNIVMTSPYAAPEGLEGVYLLLAIIFCIVVFIVGMLYLFTDRSISNNRIFKIFKRKKNSKSNKTNKHNETSKSNNTNEYQPRTINSNYQIDLNKLNENIEIGDDKLCPSCLNLTPKSSNKCSRCGYSFLKHEEIHDEKIKWKFCPECHHRLNIVAKKCPYCKYNFVNLDMNLQSTEKQEKNINDNEKEVLNKKTSEEKDEKITDKENTNKNTANKKELKYYEKQAFNCENEGDRCYKLDLYYHALDNYKEAKKFYESLDSKNDNRQQGIIRCDEKIKRTNNRINEKLSLNSSSRSSP